MGQVQACAPAQVVPERYDGKHGTRKALCRGGMVHGWQRRRRRRLTNTCTGAWEHSRGQLCFKQRRAVPVPNESPRQALVQAAGARLAVARGYANEDTVARLEGTANGFGANTRDPPPCPLLLRRCFISPLSRRNSAVVSSAPAAPAAAAALSQQYSTRTPAFVHRPTPTRPMSNPLDP